MRSNYEVVVVGGGPAGVSAAIHLVRAGISTCLLAEKTPPSSLPGETLTARARFELNGLGLSDFSDAVAVPSVGIEAAWNARRSFHSQILDPLGSGWHVDRHAFHGLLLETTIREGVDVERGRVSGLNKTSTGVTVTCSGDDVSCKVLIDATGRAARVAHMMGDKRRRLDSLCSVSAIIHSDNQTKTLMVESTPNGWWYSAPLPVSKTLVVFLSDADILRQLGATDPRVWAALFQRTTFLSQAVRIKRPADLAVHPCETAILERIHDDAWLAVGDAACVVDPLSSQGVPKALRSGREAANAVKEHLAGESSAFHRYAENVSVEFQQYLAARTQQYDTELRWRSHPFWFRRQEWRV